MKLIRRLLKKNNRGMSLVELICAVAILGLATSAIGGAMVVSARHYQRDSLELEVQQEAQTTTNLVGNLIVDSTYAEWVDADDKLKITNNGVNYEIYKDGTTLKYFDGTNTGVLAEYVEDFEVVVPADFQKDKNVMVNLSIKKDAKEFNASYNTTSRNGDLSNINDDDIMVVLSVEQNWVIEPNQELRFNVVPLHINDVSEVGGLTLNTATVPTGWDVDMSGNEVIVRAPEDANGYITFDVRTIDEVAGVPIASKEIRVDVRRVSGVNLTLSHIPGTGAATKANAEYKVVASVSGSNLDEGDSHYDDGVYEYVNPYSVDFSVSMTGLPEGAVESDYYEVPAATKVEDNVTNPEMIIKLKQDMPENSTITIRGIAKHPEGLWTDVAVANPYNKASKSGMDIPYGTRKEDFVEIVCVEQNYITPQSGGMKRGQDFFFTTADHLKLNDKRLQVYAANVNNGNAAALGLTSDGQVGADWFFRYKESGTSDWTHYIKMVEDGEDMKIVAEETLQFYPTKAYDFEIIEVVYVNSSKKILWPCDETLLTDTSTGFADSGFSKGWSDSAAPNDFNDYGGSFPLGAIEVLFAGMDKFGMTDAASIIGNKLSPKSVTVPTPGNEETVDILFDTLNMEKGHFNYGLKAFKYNESGETAVTSITGLQEWTNTGSVPTIKLSNGAKDSTTRYKFGVTLANARFTELIPNKNNILNPQTQNIYVTCDIFDDTQGVMYVIFE